MFRPDRLITILFAEEKFDKVGVKTFADKADLIGDWHPYYNNLETCQEDIVTIQDILSKYKISAED